MSRCGQLCLSVPGRLVMAAALYALMLHPSSAQTFYRCLGVQGQPEFSAQPCETGRAPVPRASVAPLARQPGQVDSPACRQARQALAAASSAGVFPLHHELKAQGAAVRAACRPSAPEVTIVNRPAPP